MVYQQDPAVKENVVDIPIKKQMINAYLLSKVQGYLTNFRTSFILLTKLLKAIC